MRSIDTLKFLGGDFKRDAQLAKLNMSKAFVNFVNLFPDKFQIEGNHVKSLEQDPRIGSAGQPLRRLRRMIAPMTTASRGPLDAFST